MKDLDPRAAKENLEKQRFMVLSLLRLSGAVLVIFGFLCIAHRIAWFKGDVSTAIGAMFALSGLVQSLVLPRILIRAWRTPPAE
jgi:uncharacterized membrane protein